MIVNIPVTLILTLLAALCGNTAKKYYIANTSRGTSAVFLFGAVSSLSALTVLFLLGGFSHVSLFTVILGCGFGIVTVLQSVALLTALRIGPLSYTTVINSFSTLITALSGVIFFNEHLSGIRIVGIILMLTSFLLAANPGSEKKGMSFRWLVLCSVSFVATGGIGIMQKLHQTSPYKHELSEFLILSFSVSAVLSTVVFLALHRCESHGGSLSEKACVKDRMRAVTAVAIMLLGGTCIAFNHKCNLFLSGVMDSAVFFPIVNGGTLVLTTLASMLLFRERLTKRQGIGIILGIASVLLLCSPW